ncbi:MAG: CoA-binding protein [Actinomycetota bacterium]|nr:CoA-binding protein [Actinomycetota bacterium]
MSRTPRQLLESVHTIAVVGCSTQPHKAAHRIPAILQSAGYRVLPVHRTASEVLGEAAFPTLADIGEPVDLVNVFRPSEECAGVARQAVDVGASAVWLQLGLSSPDARRIVETAGMDYVENDCTGARVQAWGLRAPQ